MRRVGRKTPRRDELTDAEWSVMNALWEIAPATARGVLEAVRSRTGWAYTTVRTLLERLVEKGAVRARREGNADVYTPALPRAGARKAALRALLDRAFGGAPSSMAQFLLGSERLSAADRRALVRLLEDQDREERRP
jgi:predicted transcriptional regulator